jgi:hypothetical protein
LYFDGTSAFLSTRLVSTDILASPDRATQGLAFGIKLKFDGAVKQYDTPRYVLDTGATSGGKTGISLYVLNGKLIAEIATSSMKWKVQNCSSNIRVLLQIVTIPFFTFHILKFPGDNQRNLRQMALHYRQLATHIWSRHCFEWLSQIY